MLHVRMKLMGHVTLTTPLVRGNVYDANPANTTPILLKHLQSVVWEQLLPCYLMRFGSLIIFEFNLKIHLSVLLSSCPKRKWLDEAFLGLNQPLHADDKKGKETCSSQKTPVLGICPILFFVCFQQNFSHLRARKNTGRN